MEIQKYVADVFREYGWFYTPEKVNLTEMWAIINKKNNFNIEHTHPNNYLSAAYYVKAPENCGSFNVSNPNQVAKERIAISNKRTEFNQNIAQIKPVAGDLLLFPAYLPHSVGKSLFFFSLKTTFTFFRFYYFRFIFFCKQIFCN